MIYTVTCNPALDYIIKLPFFQGEALHRANAEQILEGGKGINVAIVLQHLGLDAVALGFVAGFTGQEIERRLRARGCPCDFVTLSEGFSRINVKMQVPGWQDTELNGQGPQVSDQEWEQLLAKLRLLQAGDTLVLSGNCPCSLPADAYQQMLVQAHRQGVCCVVDTSGRSLLDVLPYKPYLIKPNRQELEELYSGKESKKEDLIAYAQRLQEKGARNILLSLGKDGALFFSETGEIWEQKAPEGTVVQPSGAGDSMVAGFLAGLQRYGTVQDALRLAVAAGSASAFSAFLAERQETEDLLLRLEDAILLPTSRKGGTIE